MSMADSDDEYVQDLSDDEVEAHQVTRAEGASSRATGQGSRVAGWEGMYSSESICLYAIVSSFERHLSRIRFCYIKKQMSKAHCYFVRSGCDI